MDHRLVSAAQRDRALLLRSHQSTRWPAREELRPVHTERGDSEKSDEGRIVLMRSELLPAVPARRTHGATDRHVNVSSRISLHHAREDECGVKDFSSLRSSNKAMAAA